MSEKKPNFTGKRGRHMPGKRMTRWGEAEALRRVENAARTTGEFKELTDLYDKLDGNRERRERSHEVGNFESMYLIVIKNEDSDYSVKLSYNDGAVIPSPLKHPYWKELMRGDFISTIYDNADEIWQIIGDWQVGRLIKELTAKQRDVLFRSAVRQCSSEQIAECTGKTKRGVNKLLAAAFEYIRPILAKQIKARLDNELPVTLEKQRFYEWYKEETPDKKSDE